MLASILAAQVALFVSGACTEGSVVSCTLSGCIKAQKYCEGGYWSPCECLVPAGCTPGEKDYCGASGGCLSSWRTCSSSGQWSSCSCLCSVDTNACTADSWTGSQCLHSPLTTPCCAAGTPIASACCDAGVQKAAGTSCSDGDQCNGLETCDGSARCIAGAPPVIDDLNPCTFDRCDPATGTVTHPLASSDSQCTSGTFYCHDKYGNVVKAAVCVAGVPCDTGCP